MKESKEKTGKKPGGQNRHPGTTLFDVGGLHPDMEDLLGVSVDIITSGARMNSHMKTTLTQNAVPV